MQVTLRHQGPILGWGRSSGGGHSNPLQYSCLENPIKRGAWWATIHRVCNNLACMHPLTCLDQKISSSICTHIMDTHTGILVSLKTEGSPVIWDNVAEPEGHYARWKKPDRKRQVLPGWATVHRVAMSCTQWKWLSTHTHTHTVYLWNLKKKVQTQSNRVDW